MNLFEVDRKISEISSGMKFYSFLTPVNQAEERARFFAAIANGEKYDPVFDYRESYLSVFREELSELKEKVSPGGVMGSLFSKKIDFLLTQIMVLTEGDEGLLENSLKLFGRPDDECIRESLEMVSQKEEEVFTEETVSPESMRAILEAYIKDKGIEWDVRLSDKMIPKITVSGGEATLYINSRLHYTPQEVERLKVHEVEVHIFRGANGKRQPYRIFSEGTCGYNETEEGLAIVNEQKRGVLDLDRRQMRLYAGRAICSKLCLEGGFFDAFSELTRYFPDYIAYRLVERAKRGLRDTSKKGALTKGYHYISGFRKMRKFTEEGGGDIKILYIGKIGIDDIKGIEELLAEGVLKEPSFLPDFI